MLFRLWLGFSWNELRDRHIDHSVCEALQVEFLRIRRPWLKTLIQKDLPHAVPFYVGGKTDFLKKPLALLFRVSVFDLRIHS